MGFRAGLDAVAKRKESHYCPCRESHPNRTACSLVTVLAELPWLPLFPKLHLNIKTSPSGLPSVPARYRYNNSHLIYMPIPLQPASFHTAGRTRPPLGLTPCLSTCCGWRGLRALMTPRVMLAVA